MRFFLVISMLIGSLGLHAQGQLELYRGNQAYMEGSMDEAQTAYQKSLEEAPNSFEGTYNLGNATYRAEDFESAVQHYKQAASTTEDKLQRSKVMHNLGNTYLQNQKFEDAVGAYKQALRLNPSDDETRYNLAYAQKLLDQQQQQEQEQEQEQDQDQDQDQEEQDQEEEEKDDQEKEEQENDQDGENEDKSDKEEEQDKGDEEQSSEDGEQKEEEGAQKPIKLSPREAEQLLEAAKNEDQQLQMQLRKQQGEPKKIDKDW